MRPFRKIRIQPEKLNSIQIIQNRTRSPPISRFKRLVILSLLLVFIITIVVTIISLKDSTEKSTISSPIHSNFSSTNGFFIHSTGTTPIDELESNERTTNDNRTDETRVISWNLLDNPGAESQLDHWIQIGDTPVITDSNGSFHSDIYPYKGRSCFAGGYTELGTRSQLLQSIDLLNSTNDQIDSGTLQLEISFHYQTWHHPNRTDDIIEVDVIFFTNSLNIIDRIHTGELICRISNPKWCYYRKSFPLPSDTRTIYYIMIFSKNDRTDTSLDVYIDENSLMII